MPKTKNHSLSQREKLLLPLALTVIFVVLYGAARLRPGLAKIEQLKKELSTAVQGRETLSWPSQTNSDTAILRQEISRLERTNGQLADRLAVNESSLANLATSSELQGLRIQISALARKHHIKVIKNIPHGSDNDDSRHTSSPLQLSDAPDSPTKKHAPIIHEFFQLMYARPLQELELTANYSALQQFIQSLSTLEHRVNVVSFEIKMDERSDQLTQPRLSSHLVLAL